MSKGFLNALDDVRMRTLAPDVRMLWLDIARLPAPRRAAPR